MEIKVGEYVRLARCQGINKIIDINEEGDLILDEIIADEYAEETQIIRLEDIGTEIKKHRFNLIELIEIDDYINGHRVVKIKNDEGRVEIGLENDYMINYYIEEQDIKTILTHEQYERNCYRIN